MITLRRLTMAALISGLVAIACGTSVFDLGVGDCFNDPDNPTFEVSSVETVECSEAHDNEVYATINYSATDSYPGDSEMFEYAAEACLDPFEAFVGASYISSSLDYAYLTPTQASWNEGDREILCFLYDLDWDKLTGSMRGSGI